MAITDENGRSYTKVGELGIGGQGIVLKVQANDNGRFYAFKAYKHNKNNIRENIEELVKKGEIRDKEGRVLTSLVLPRAMVPLKKGDAFGYVMDLVDLDDYVTLIDAWDKKKYPSCGALCRFVQNLAYVFDVLHRTHGMCYKDVNEGNIFFNPSNGDIKIIDNDNVGFVNSCTVYGTSGYMAPEIVLGLSNPNQNSDQFSFAVFMYRLLVGGYPFEGPYTIALCKKQEILPQDAAELIFRNDPVFVWHPSDRRNALIAESGPRSAGQIKLWDQLPRSVKELFIDVFVTNLPPKRSAQRASPDRWIDVFRKLESNLTVCPSCGAHTFRESSSCFSCGARLLPEINIVLQVITAGHSSRNITVKIGDRYLGQDISRYLASGNLFDIVYDAAGKRIGIRNISRSAWRVAFTDGSRKDVDPGKIVELKKGIRISLIKRTVQINVVEVL